MSGGNSTHKYKIDLPLFSLIKDDCRGVQDSLLGLNTWQLERTEKESCINVRMQTDSKQINIFILEKRILWILQIPTHHEPLSLASFSHKQNKPPITAKI